MAIGREEHSIARLRQDFDTLWDRFLEGWQTGGLGLWDEPRWFGSRLDLDENEKEFVLHADLPGFEPEEIDVSISGNRVVLCAKHKEEAKKDNGNYRRYGSVCESFTLPESVLADKIDARYHSGILELHMPKTEQSQMKRIEVKAN